VNLWRNNFAILGSEEPTASADHVLGRRYCGHRASKKRSHAKQACPSLATCWLVWIGDHCSDGTRLPQSRCSSSLAGGARSCSIQLNRLLQVSSGGAGAFHDLTQARRPPEKYPKRQRRVCQVVRRRTHRDLGLHRSSSPREPRPQVTVFRLDHIWPLMHPTSSVWSAPRRARLSGGTSWRNGVVRRAVPRDHLAAAVAQTRDIDLVRESSRKYAIYSPS